MHPTTRRPITPRHLLTPEEKRALRPKPFNPASQCPPLDKPLTMDTAVDRLDWAVRRRIDDVPRALVVASEESGEATDAVAAYAGKYGHPLVRIPSDALFESFSSESAADVLGEDLMAGSACSEGDAYRKLADSRHGGGDLDKRFLGGLGRMIGKAITSGGKKPILLLEDLDRLNNYQQHTLVNKILGNSAFNDLGEPVNLFNVPVIATSLIPGRELREMQAENFRTRLLAYLEKKHSPPLLKQFISNILSF